MTRRSLTYKRGCIGTVAQTVNNSDMDDPTDESEPFPHDSMPDEPGGAVSVASRPAPQTSTLSGKRIALVGRFGSMNRREAANLLRSYDAIVTDIRSQDLDWVVLGAEESPLAEQELLPRQTMDAAGLGRVTILHEAEFWQRIGLVDANHASKQYYTPAMLAEILGVSVHVVRRWHRRGLIVPARTMHKLPYFDFREVATAKRLAQWVATGASPKTIEQRLVDLIEVLPDLQRPLDQLSILVEGKHVLLRQGEGLIEPGGQLRFDFDALETGPIQETEESSVLSMDSIAQPNVFLLDAEGNQDDLLTAAFEAEDMDDLETAVDYCHAILARDGPRADISFQIGELLYRLDRPIAARERFYNAIEIEPEFVEARVSLAAILAETKQEELAVAAYRGVLDLHENYPDAHFQLARLLTAMDRPIEATVHWKRFLALAPKSPSAEEARRQLLETEQ